MLKKYLLTLLITLLVGMFSSSQNVAYALSCGSYDAHIKNGDAPAFTDIVCPFSRIVNGFLLVSGIVFMVIVVYGGIKLSMSFGDPKAFEGGKTTWTYAVIGFAVVLGFFLILAIVMGILGSTYYTTPDSFFTELQSRIRDFLTGMQVYNNR
jgi:hypothetical protein